MRIILPLILFLTVFLVYFCSEVITSFDSRWVIPTAYSIIKEGNTDLDEYDRGELDKDEYRIEIIAGHYYTVYPVGVALLAVPFVYLADKLIDPLQAIFPGFKQYVTRRAERPLDSLTVLSLSRGLELTIASLFMALATVFIYAISRFYLIRKQALLIALIFAFCTSVWSIASRGLHQHGPAILLLTIILYLILLAKYRNASVIQYVGLPLAFSFAVRPTNCISILLFSIFIFVQYRKYFLRFILWALIVTVPFIIYNYSIYHALISPYYTPQKIGGTSHFWEALAGNLISPARGLFIFSPILLFSVLGMWRAIKEDRREKLNYCLVCIILLHLITISSFPTWWAGTTYGPRFFSDMIPFFSYFLIFAVTAIARMRAKTVLMGAFIILAGLSAFIHFRGATDWAVYRWNIEPVSVDLEPQRVWDWHDIQFLRGL